MKVILTVQEAENLGIFEKMSKLFGIYNSENLKWKEGVYLSTEVILSEEQLKMLKLSIKMK